MAADPLDTFMTWMRVEQGRAVNTLSAYQRDITHYVKWLKTQHATVMNATAQHLEKFVAHLRSAGKAPKSVARQFAAVRMFYRYLAQRNSTKRFHSLYYYLLDLHRNRMHDIRLDLKKYEQHLFRQSYSLRRMHNQNLD